MTSDVAKPSSRSCEAVMGNAIGSMLRDVGSVMFCEVCKRAEMPGTIRCSRCGRAVEPARVAKLRLAAREAA